MGDGVNRRILIVDDNEDIHKDFHKILGSSKKKVARLQLDALESQLFAEDDHEEESTSEGIKNPDTGIPRANSIYDVEYEIDSAYQGLDGVELVRTALNQGRPYALIFMDVRMPPGIDGIETIARIWEISNNVEIVICTAFSDYSHEQILEKLGSTDRLLFLNKPFDSIVVKQMALSLTRKWTLHEDARRHVVRLRDEINQRKESESQLHHLIHHDTLTGLGNRNQMQIDLSRAIDEARYDHTRFALFFIDLDRFKEVNDTLGYHNGDKLLFEVGRRLSEKFDRYGSIFRHGGDEFAILMPKLDSLTSIERFANELQLVFEPHFEIDGLSIEVQPSIGIVIYPDNGCNIDMLMRHADITLVNAKKTEQGFRFYKEHMNLYSQQRLMLLSELRRAVSDDDLMLYFQPRVNLQTGMVMGVEALTRWPHAIHGFIPPSEFIPIAESCGMIKHLTSWVLKEVPRHWTIWREKGLDLRISVNLTSQELLDPQLPQKIETALEPYEMPYDRLSFEVSESGVMEDPMQARNLMRIVSDMGVTIAIDNFGTGYSSLAYLKQLPVQEIKIDHSFVGDMHLNEQKIVRSMINLGHNLGLRVVADGVTSEESYQKLRDFGCDYLQGSVVNVAVPAGEIMLWLQHGKWKVERHLQTA